MESPLCPGSFLTISSWMGAVESRGAAQPRRAQEAWLGPDKEKSPPLTTWRERGVWTWRVCRPMFSQGEMSLSTGEQGRPVRFQGGATPPSFQLFTQRCRAGVPARYDFYDHSLILLPTAGSCTTEHRRALCLDCLPAPARQKLELWITD